MPRERTGKSSGGRPSIGPLIKLNLPSEFVKRAERYARQHDRKRADVLREWCMQGAPAEQSDAA